MFIAVARDLALDLTLESEARTILITVGFAVGVLLLATVVVLHAHHLRKFGRYIFRIPTPMSNQTESEVRISNPLFSTSLQLSCAGFYERKRK